MKSLCVFSLLFVVTYSWGTDFQLSWKNIVVVDSGGTRVEASVTGDSNFLGGLTVTHPNGVQCRAPAAIFSSIPHVDLSETRIVYSTSPLSINPRESAGRILKVSIALFEFNSQFSDDDGQYRLEFILEGCEFRRWFKLEADSGDIYFDHEGKEISRIEVLQFD